MIKNWQIDIITELEQGKLLIEGVAGVEISEFKLFIKQLGEYLSKSDNELLKATGKKITVILEKEE